MGRRNKKKKVGLPPPFSPLLASVRMGRRGGGNCSWEIVGWEEGRGRLSPPLPKKNIFLFGSSAVLVAKVEREAALLHIPPLSSIRGEGRP